MTDGQENRSTQLTTAQARALLDDCRARNWQVIFLGANFDNAAQARGYGAAPSATASVISGRLVGALSDTAKLRTEYALRGVPMSFNEDEKRKLAGKS